MKNKACAFALSLGAIALFTALLVEAQSVFAFSSTFNCSLSAGNSCGQSHSAYSFDSYVNSASPSVTICAGYEISGTITCTDVSPGNYGSSFTGMSSVSFSSFYRNDGTVSTSGSFTDTWCNCFGPSP